MKPKASICIACHNQGHFLKEAIESCLMQDFENIELIVLDDASKDNTQDICISYGKSIKYKRSEAPSGSGEAFNKAIEMATGDVIVLLCADDVFTHKSMITDMMMLYAKYPMVIHITRFYHQFIDGDRRPVRAWRCENIIELANNPSGLSFRTSAIKGSRLSNKMFVEAPTMVYRIMMANKKGLSMFLPWDTVAVRIHQSTARSKDYYKKRWTSSPVEEWSKIGGAALQRDFTSLIQIKNYFTVSAVLKECFNFVKLRQFTLLEPAFWFYAIVSILTPRCVLIFIPDIYRKTFGRWTTKVIKRPEDKKPE